MPGCQVVFTVIGPDGKTLILNKMAQVPDNGSMVAGLDMSPVQPHTTEEKLELVNLVTQTLKH